MSRVMSAVALVGMVFLSPIHGLSGEGLAGKPNVILIVADDFGYECLTANGGESYQTPHLDRLAAAGIRFEHCHVQPLCTPTRVQLMTGLYNVRNYVNFGTLARTETTFAHLIQKAGYVTGVCGKWQLGREPDSPRHFGFDESFLWQHTRRPPRYANPGLEHNGRELNFTKGEYGPQLVNDFVLDFFTRHRQESFFLYYPMMLTHGPFQPIPDSPEYDPKALGENANADKKHFADMVHYMDKLVGQIDVKLGELGLRENTLILFVGDNGTGAGITSRFDGRDYKGGKGQTSARGTHVPCLASWPAVIKTGRVCLDLISSVDFLPTICQAVGAELPTGLDGVSFLPQLRGEAGSPRLWLYSWYSPYQETPREWVFDHHHMLYRDGRFFDLQSDANESRPLNVASLTGQAAEAATKLQAALDQFKDARPEALKPITATTKKAAKGKKKKGAN